MLGLCTVRPGFWIYRLDKTIRGSIQWGFCSLVGTIRTSFQPELDNGWWTDVSASAIAIVCLEYGLGEGKSEVKLSYSFQHSLDEGARYWAIFMTREVIGVMVDPAQDPGEDRLEILACNIASGAQTVIQTDITAPVSIFGFISSTRGYGLT